jgi:predicted DNA-binding ribbon-helix-helix protein
MARHSQPDLILLNVAQPPVVKSATNIPLTADAPSSGPTYKHKETVMKSAIVKRSVVLDGHKTSVSLENEFWEGLRAIAERQKANLSSLVRQIDRNRSNGNLSSAIRVFVFNHFRSERTEGPQLTTANERHAQAVWPVSAR